MLRGNTKTLRPGPNSSERSRIFLPCAAVLVLAMVATLGGAQSRKGKNQSKDDSQPALGVQLISVNGYPELHVDGRPFFVHAAEFSYFRMPLDQWSDSLDRYRELGINTIDIRIPWNWHEPSEGAFDFDGHTNPRRDLRLLLKMIAEKGFRLIVRPGPIIGNEWRNGGYPDWLLSRAEFRANPADRPSGFPPPRGLSEAAFETHILYATEWLAAVAHELAPYNPSNIFTLAVESPGDDKPKEKKVSGPLLFVFLNDSVNQNLSNFTAPEYWNYVSALREVLLAAGIKPGFAGAIAVSAAHAEAGFAYPGDASAIGVAGEWFLGPESRARSAGAQSAGARMADSDAETLALLAQSLRTQPAFPPLIAGFQAGWFAPADDTNPPATAPANTLLASRWLLGQGITGIEYSPLQDTLTPPGYQTAAANREFRWDAALDINGVRGPRARAVDRNSRMLATWGEFLATSHPRAEIGIVDVRELAQASGLSAQAGEGGGREFTLKLRQIERVTSFGGYFSELVDPEHQTLDSLLRDPLILLVIPPSLRDKQFLSGKAQNALLEYVRRGGTLVCQPKMPAGAAFDQTLNGAAVQDSGEVLRTAKLGEGKLIEWAIDIFSWASLDESFAENLARPEAAWAAEQLHMVVGASGGFTRIVSSSDHPSGLLVSELAANASAGTLGAPAADCEKHPRCGAGLLSVTNWRSGETLQDTLTIVPPAANARAPKDDDVISLPVEIPPRESLLLPINIPLCPEDVAADSCRDKIVAAGAEFMGATRSGNELDLTFYAPTKATVLVKLGSTPLGVELPAQIPAGQSDKPLFPERSLEGHFNLDTHVFRVEIPRGAAPDFVRDLRLRLSYKPDVPERPKPAKRRTHDFRYSIADAVRLPLGRASLATDPPLVMLGADGSGRIVVHAQSLTDAWITVQASVEGAARGSERLHLEDREEQFLIVNLTGSAAANSLPDPKANVLQPGTLTFTGDRSINKQLPLTFLTANGDDPAGYEYDFERSGSKNWVLENKNMRLILLPDAGGEIAALVDKTTGANFTTTVGGLRDLIRLPDGGAPEGATVDPTFNLPYRAQWITESGHPIISLEAAMPEGAPLSGSVKKEVRLETKDGKETVEVHYVFTPNSHESGPAPADAPRDISNSATTAKASLVTAFSSPAAADGPDRTQFCWFANSLQEGPAANSAAASVDDAHCSPFVAGGAAILLPAEAKRLEVRTAGQPALAMEWDAGRVSIEQKQFSARLLVELPAGGAPGNAAEARLRYTILRTP
jgi:hypothetical protein